MNTNTDPAAPETQTSGSETKSSTEAQTQTDKTSTPDGSGGGADTEGAGKPDAPWQDALPDDLKTNPLFRGYKTPEEAMKAHAHLYKQRGVPAERLLTVPDKSQADAPDDWAPLHKALGVPDDPKDYDIKLAPEAAADAAGLETVLRELGGKAKFQPGQMAAVIETLNELGAKASEAEAAEKAAETQTVNAALKTEWGAAFEGNKRAIGKLMRDALGGEIDEAALADLEKTVGANLTLSRILAHAAAERGEPETPEGGGRAAGGRQQPTPAAARAAVNALYADAEKMKALNDRKHPQHAAVLNERRDLLAMARGEKRPDQPS